MIHEFNLCFHVSLKFCKNLCPFQACPPLMCSYWPTTNRSLLNLEWRFGCLWNFRFLNVMFTCMRSHILIANSWTHVKYFGYGGSKKAFWNYAHSYTMIIIKYELQPFSVDQVLLMKSAHLHLTYWGWVVYWEWFVYPASDLLYKHCVVTCFSISLHFTRSLIVKENCLGLQINDIEPFCQDEIALYRQCAEKRVRVLYIFFEMSDLFFQIYFPPGNRLRFDVILTVAHSFWEEWTFFCFYCSFYTNFQDNELRKRLQQSELTLGSSMPLDEAKDRAAQLQSDITTLERYELAN